MRDQLIGYLLNALEPGEHEAVEQALERDTELREELGVLARSLSPLRGGREEYSPPLGLASRTMEFVREQSALRPAPLEMAPASVPARWTLPDVVVAAAVLFTLALLFIPALGQSRFMARLATCQDNLRSLGASLAGYSQRHDGYLPKVAPEGRFGVAGMYAVWLSEEGQLGDARVLLCPGSDFAEPTHEFRVPSVAQIRAASETDLVQIHRRMGGDYASWLNYVSNGLYRATKHRSQARLAVLADRPMLRGGAQAVSLHHDGRGQNVLFDDGHVEFAVDCCVRGCGDNFYFNDFGLVAAGASRDDAVLAPSGTRPLRVSLPYDRSEFGAAEICLPER